MKIFIGGSLNNIEKYGEVCNPFVERLAELAMERGHIILNGCRGSLDKKVAESAAAWLQKNGKDPRSQIRSYILENEEGNKVHDVGTILVSELKDWSIEKEKTEVPEQIKLADITIFIAGTNGTFRAATFARFANKPILGIGMFGGSGRKLNISEKENFETNYSHLLNGELTYENLNQVTTDVDCLAKEIISLCEDLMRSSIVYSIMSFKPEFNDVFEIFSSICAKNDYKAIRTDKDPNFNPITSRILEGIRQSDFVIADVSEMSPNVFYEIGFAKGINRQVIITAKIDTPLPFDIKDLQVIYYDRLNLKETLEPKLEKWVSSVKINN